MINYEELKAAILASESLDALPDAVKPPLPKCAGDQNYVFISYSHKDYKAVYCDLLELHRAGVRYWYDYGLPAGKDWDAVVEDKIKGAGCAGVIFYLSEQLFLSRSIGQEVAYTIDDEGGKNYFCINLTGVQPTRILNQITRRYTDEELDSFGIEERRGTLTRAFSDKATYITKASDGDIAHIARTVEQITEQFNVSAVDGDMESDSIRRLEEQLKLANTFSIKDGELLGYMGEEVDVVVPDGVNWIGMGAFRNCRSLRSVKLPAGVKGISRSVFVRCACLVSVELPEGMTLIGDGAFAGCISLREIRIPDSVDTLVGETFHHCIALERVWFPRGVKKIETCIFADCECLTDVYYNGTIAEWNAIEKISLTGGDIEYTVHCTDGDVPQE